MNGDKKDVAIPTFLTENGAKRKNKRVNCRCYKKIPKWCETPRGFSATAERLFESAIGQEICARCRLRHLEAATRASATGSDWWYIAYSRWGCWRWESYQWRWRTPPPRRITTTMIIMMTTMMTKSILILHKSASLHSRSSTSQAQIHYNVTYISPLSTSQGHVHIKIIYMPKAFISEGHIHLKVIYIIIGTVGVLDNLFVLLVFILFIKITKKVLLHVDGRNQR